MPGLRGLLPAAAAFLLLLPAAASAGPGDPPPAPTLRGDRATAQGAADLLGELAGLAFDEGPADGAAFLLTGAHGRMEVRETYSDPWFVVGVPPIPKTAYSNVTLQDAQASAFRLAPLHRILLLPNGTGIPFEASLADAALAAATQGTLEFEPRGIPGPPLRIEAAGTLALSAAGNPVLAVHAPFTLVLWETDVTLTQNGSSQEVDTGTSQERVDPNVPLVQNQTQREAFLHVERGTLLVPLPSLAFARTVRVATDGLLDVAVPQGTLPIDHTAIPPGSQRLSMTGPLEATFTAAGDQVAAGFSDEPARLVLDGVAVQPAAPRRQAGIALALAWLAAAAAALAVVALRRRRAARTRQLRALLEARRYEEALALSRRLGSRHEEARLAQATCLIHMGRYAQAQDVLEGRRDWSPGARGMQYYLRACAAGGQGDRRAATDLLVHCLFEAPAFAAEAMANPLLSGIVKAALAQRTGAAGQESYA